MLLLFEYKGVIMDKKSLSFSRCVLHLWGKWRLWEHGACWWDEKLRGVYCVSLACLRKVETQFFFQSISLHLNFARIHFFLFPQFFRWMLLFSYDRYYWHLLSARRSPISIAAAVIYIITQLSDDKKPPKGLCHTSYGETWKQWNTNIFDWFNSSWKSSLWFLVWWILNLQLNLIANRFLKEYSHVWAIAYLYLT